jgi:RHS repeat-associated protein
MNVDRAPALIYSSQHAAPVPVIAANVWGPRGIKGGMRTVLKVGGVEKAVESWPAQNWVRRLTVGFDAAEVPTGAYGYSLEVVLDSASDQRVVNGKLVVVNRSNSVFGAGWWMAGLEELVASGTSWLWVGGDGSTRLYQPTTTVNPTKWVAINPDRGPDTLSLAAGRYTRTLPDRTRVLFDGTGRQVATISRQGHQTDFSYDSSGRLSMIQLAAPAGVARQSYAFSWGTDRYTVTAPGGRTTVVTLENGRVTGIQDPDSLSILFSYADATSRLITRQTDKSGTPTTYKYTKVGNRLIQVDDRPNLTVEFQPVETRSLKINGVPAQGSSSGTALETRTVINGPRLDLMYKEIWTDRYGAPVLARDNWSQTILLRGDARFPALVTETRTITGTTRMVYDDRGNPVRITAVDPYGDGRDAVTSYEYADPLNPSLPTRITDPEGEVTRYSYLSNGNLAWQQPGDDATRRWTYSYNTNQQLMKADPPGPAPAESLSYDIRGNLASVSTSMGFTTYYLKDTLGRDTSIVLPPTPSGTRRQSIRYDGMDRVVSTRDIGVGSTTMWTSVTHRYDVNGNRIESRVWGRSGTADSIPGGVSSWVYDKAGRMVIRRTPVSTDTLSYDASGNVVRMASSNGDVVVMGYDGINRLTYRTIPAKSYPGEFIAAYPGDSVPILGTHPLGWQFPAFSPSGLVIPADTQRYTYTGTAIKTANNRYAKISRSYYPGGALKTDSIAIRDYSGSGFSTYVYGLSYSYDRNGRRTTLQHPSALSAGATTYSYLPTTGELQTITDPNGTPYTYSWNVVGLPSGIHTPGGTDTLTWDNDGRLTELAIQSVIGRGLIETYDAMGRRTKGVTYDPLGSVTQALQWNPNGVLRLTETFGRDPFGNATVHRAMPPNYPYANAGYPLPEDNRYVEGGRITSRVKTRVPIPGIPDLNPGFQPERASWSYDGRGNLEKVRQFEFSDFAPVVNRSASRSYYDGEGKLMVQQVNRDSLLFESIYTTELGLVYVFEDHTVNSNWGAYEEYWYDALGRRVLKRSRQEAPICMYALRCVSSTERTVWDGDQILWELRDQNTAGPANPPAGVQTGKIGYVHGGGVDEPLGLIHNGTTNVLHRNVRGQYLMATAVNGEGIDPGIIWPGNVWSAQEAVTIFTTEDPHRARPWYGSLVMGQADRSGLSYRRNRYYSPDSGQFTQPDPIGIAGGLNVYGYANGDPVNYRDPFGLKAEDVFIGCRPLADSWGKVRQHCAIRIVDDKGGEEVYELLNVNRRNSVGSPASAEEVAKYSSWTKVDVPVGMSSSQFDDLVQINARVIGSQRDGEKYSPLGGKNSNRYVWDVIQASRSMVPHEALLNRLLAPGICGGSAFSTGVSCKR